MDISQNTPTDSITVAGEVVKVHVPYVKGHSVDELEASTLNQTRKENIRNNLREIFKKEKKKGANSAALQVLATKYSQEYNFGQSGGGGATMDPVDKESIAIATDAIKKAMRADGKSPKDVSAKDLRAAALKVIERNPHIKEQAAQIVKARAGVSINMGGGNEGGGEEKAAGTKK